MSVQAIQYLLKVQLLQNFKAKNLGKLLSTLFQWAGFLFSCWLAIGHFVFRMLSCYYSSALFDCGYSHLN